MGDWGGVPIFPYHTPAETYTAKAMGNEAVKINASFALALGDNFYETGIDNEHDKRFKHTFEDVFTADSLKGQDFWKVCAGNHDHKGNVSGQIEYSKISARWYFPSLYYTWTDIVDAETTLQTILIDTVTLAGDSSDALNPLDGIQYPGPADAAAASAQLQWLNETLAASTANYIVVGGHFPVFSVCEHGPTSSMVANLKPLLEKYHVSLYFSGHDHCEEHIDVGTGVQYHVVGAANQNQGSKKHIDSVPKAELKFLDIGTGIIAHEFEGGFAAVHVDSSGMVVKHYRSDSDGYDLKYTAPAIPKRPAM